MPRQAPTSSLTPSGKVDGLLRWYDRQLCGGAERPVGLGAEHPHPPADPGRVDVLAD